MYKKTIVTIMLGIIVTFLKSQVPEKIAYQAVIRDSNGAIVTNSSVHIRVSFIDGVSSTSYYSEEHTVQTSSQGIISVELGSGTQQIGSFVSINWASGNIKLRVEIEKSSSWVEMGLVSLISVPYALYAANSVQGEPGVGIESAVLNSDSTLTFNFTNSTSYTTPIGIIGRKGDKGDPGTQGEIGLTGLQGETGTGVESAVLNSDSTLTLTFTNSTSYTTPIRIVGRKGDKGDQGIQGLQGLTGSTGNGISSIVSNVDGTLTINYTNGSSMTTISIIGPKGDTGEDGVSINWLGSFAGAPDVKSLNDCYYNTIDKISYVWDGDSWEIIAKDGDVGPKGDIGLQGIQGIQGVQGVVGPQGPAGVGLVLKGSWSADSVYYPGYYVFDRSSTDPLTNSMWICQDTVNTSVLHPFEALDFWVEFEAPAGQDGKSIVWLGEFDSNPINPEINQAYYNTIDKKSYVWSGAVWSVMAKDGEQGPAGPLVDGNIGESLVNNGTTWVSSDKFFNDLANSRYGILTKTPTASLDINGSLRLRGTLYDGQNLSGTTGQVLTRDATGILWQSPIISGSGANGKMAIWNGASSLTQLPNLSFVNSLEVVGNETTNPDDPIFEVKNSAGEVIFGVYQEGVRINIKDAVLTKGSRGGFAIGGLSTQTKGVPLEYFRITPDSARIYVKENAAAKGAKGGFAIGGLSTQTKAVVSRDLLFIAPDSARIYVNDSQTKGARGGFAVGGLSTQTKASPSNFMQLTPDNYFIGHQSGSSTTTGLYNSFFGYQAGILNTIGNYNSFMGYKSGYSNVSGSNNIFIGDSTGFTNSTGNSNVFIGNFAGFSNSSGTYNIGMGVSAGRLNSIGICNVFIGNDAGYKNTSGNFNTYIGAAAAYELNSSFNTVMGTNSGRFINSGSSNTFIGVNSAYRLGKGSQNTFVGSDCGRGGGDGYVPNPSDPESASGNVFMGFYAGGSIYNGDYNVMIGNYAGNGLYSGSSNVAIGHLAGNNNSTGNNNVFIGYQAGNSLSSGLGNVFIGYRAGYYETGSGKLYISNTYVNPPLIYGDFTLARIGLGTITPAYKLDVVGDINISSGSNYKINGVNLTASILGAEPLLTKGNLTATSPIAVSTTRQVIGGDAVISISNASTSTKGAVQLSDSYSGTSQTLATTEKALSDGLATKVSGSGAAMGKIYLTASGIIASTYGGAYDLYWDASAKTITARNTTANYSHVWWQGQQGSTFVGNAYALIPGTPSTIITITSNSWAYQISFGDEYNNGYCTVWVQYSNGKLFGHYVKY